jgi:hypothetical protein
LQFIHIALLVWFVGYIYIFHCYIILRFDHFVKNFLKHYCKIILKFTSGPRPRNHGVNLLQLPLKVPHFALKLRQFGLKAQRCAR